MKKVAFFASSFDAIRVANIYKALKMQKGLNIDRLFVSLTHNSTFKFNFGVKRKVFSYTFKALRYLKERFILNFYNLPLIDASSTKARFGVKNILSIINYTKK